MSDFDTDSHSPEREDIEARAADYLQRRRFWDWSEQDQSELDAWLAQSLAHRVTFLRLEAGADRIERLAALRPPKLERPVPRGGGGTGVRRLVSAYIATAAAIVLVVTLGFVAAPYVLQPKDRSYATEVGGRALLKFADGTQMELSTDTAVRYRITTAQRIVWLEKGEAFFRVAHDSTRPFSVIIGNRTITDLGTEFLVRADSGDLEVALLKGRAQLNSSDARTQSAVLLPGDDVVATPISLVITKKTPEQLSDALAWQRGMLVFRSTRLDEAVREFNRYNRIKMIVGDPAIAGTSVGGEFKTGNLDDFLKLAEVVLKLHVSRVGDDIVIAGETGTENNRAAHASRSE